MITDIFHVFETQPWFFYASITIFGLLVGSFLNVVIFRLPKMLENDWKCQCAELLEQPIPEQEKFTLSYPNSSCRNCGHKIRAWENIPVISYLFLNGKCSACKTKISIRYPLVELTTAILSIVIASKFGVTYTTLACLFLTWCLVALTMIDADTQLLPDSITLPLLWAGLISNYFGLLTSLEAALWGAIWGYMSLWLVYQGFKLTTGKEGMGYGDFKLLAALGAWMGWQVLPIIILLSSIVGTVIVLSLMIIKGRDKNIPIPFGPYLAIAGWIALVWGDQILRAWLGPIQ